MLLLRNYRGIWSTCSDVSYDLEISESLADILLPEQIHSTPGGIHQG